MAFLETLGVKLASELIFQTGKKTVEFLKDSMTINDSEHVQYFINRCNSQDDSDCLDLASYYIRKANFKKGLDIINRLKLNDREAEYILAKMYQFGMGVKQSNIPIQNYAYKYRGLKDNAKEYGIYLLSKNNYKEAINVFFKLQDDMVDILHKFYNGKIIFPCFYLGYLYQYGKGIEKNLSLSFQFYRLYEKMILNFNEELNREEDDILSEIFSSKTKLLMSFYYSKQEQSEFYFHFARMYERGEGTIQDKKIALNYYKLSCEMGYQKACEAYNNLNS